MPEINDQHFTTYEEGAKYGIPTYRVTGAGLEEVGELTVDFVRGSRLEEDGAPAQDGILHEGLLAMQISDLTFKNSEVRHEMTEQAIYHLKRAQEMLARRKDDRRSRGVHQTKQV